VIEALADTRVVTVVGARQAGKSTMCTMVAGGIAGARQRNLDLGTERAAASADPDGYVSHDGLMVLDEVQRAPELLLAVKAAVDADPRPGRFLLTGSARLLGLRSVPDALVGRNETIELWPFSQGEIEGTPDGFIDAVFTEDVVLERSSTSVPTDIAERIARGGMPEAVRRAADRRRRFFAAYIEDLIDRDVVQLSEIQRREQLHGLLRALAGRVAQPLSMAGLAGDLALPATTVERYTALLEEVFLIKRLPAFLPRGRGRATRQRKVLFVDSGLAASLQGLTAARLAQDRVRLGPLLENLVLGELARQITWADEPVTLSHYRTKDGVEVDGVLEHADGRVVGVEVKAATTVKQEDFRHLIHLRERSGDRFVAGIVVHLGPTTASFGGALVALPVSAVWELAP
jgi:predicted AAA+ superfamily ATPase